MRPRSRTTKSRPRSVDGEAPWYPDWLVLAGERPWVAIDFETADSQRDSACAVAMVRVENGEICDRAYSLIRPPRQAEDNVHVHGLTWEMLHDQPPFAEVWGRLSSTWRGCAYFVAHNASFDRGVLRECCFRAGIDAPDQHFEDTVRLVKTLWPEWGSARLNIACEHLGIALQHHEARSDALACATLVFEARRHVAAMLGDPRSADLGDWSLKAHAHRPESVRTIDIPPHIERIFAPAHHVFRCHRCGHESLSHSGDPGLIQRWLGQFVDEHPPHGDCHNNASLRDLLHQKGGLLKAPPLPRPAWLPGPDLSSLPAFTPARVPLPSASVVLAAAASPPVVSSPPASVLAPTSDRPSAPGLASAPPAIPRPLPRAATDPGPHVTSKPRHQGPRQGPHGARKAEVQASLLFEDEPEENVS